MLIFPEHFFWGAATSAYQVEGNNTRSDWWEWEKKVKVKEPSSAACRHYEYYRRDFALAKEFNHNCHRFSIEWGRIEPEENTFSQEALSHYKDVCRSLKQQGLEPIVTLQHFTIPVWLAEKGGWLNPACPKFFLRYVEKVVEALCEEVTYWVSINEPLVYVYHAYIIGVWPPQERSFAKSRRVTEHLLDGHCSAYSFIHALYKTKQLSPPKVSIAKNMQYFMACKATLKNSIAVYARNRFFNFEFIEKLIRRRALDFIGLNYYTRSLIDAGGFRLKNLLLDTCDDGHDVLEKNSLGWEIFPEGLYRLLMQLKRYGLPVFILENGICTEDDGLRWRFIREHLAGVHRALQEGVNVLGYVYWSLIDNYEWDKGFGPRFGLIEMDYATYNRKIRESARKLSLVCRTNALDYGTDQ